MPTTPPSEADHTTNTDRPTRIDHTTNAEPPLPAGNPWLNIRKPVFIPAVIIVVALMAFTLANASRAEEVFGSINEVVTQSLGWWYILIVTGFVIFAFYCMFTRIGTLRLGRDDEQPEFGLIPWFAMLFSAGMGIGLVFWGVAEPLNHYMSPPSINGETAEDIDAAQQAMDLTMFHWGLHAWAIYVVIGLGIAFMTYRKGRPLSIRWLLEPLIGRKRVEGVIGHAIDTVAIVGTLFGIATSLGLGVQQMLAGMVYLGWIAEPTNLAIILLIAAITAIATFSVASGVNKGLKWLSNINMTAAAFLLLAVLLVGPTVFLLQAWVGNIGGYLQELPEFMLRTSPFDALDPIDDTWLSSWTIFYWAWWMSWAPFVGMFIARISRGRTVRQFIGGVLFAPTLVASLWFTVFGDSAILRQRTAGDMVGPDGVVDTNTSLFLLLDAIPFSFVLSVVAIIVVALFFITSSDSGSLVIDMIAAGGATETPRVTRIFWAILEGVAAAVLLVAGGSAALVALQTASIVTAAPFSVVMVLACFALLKALHYEAAHSPQFFAITHDLSEAGPGEGENHGSRPASAHLRAAVREAGGVSATLRGLPAAETDSGGPPSSIFAIRQVDPAGIQIDPESGHIEPVPDRMPEDPLGGEVFDTPEFEQSAQGQLEATRPSAPDAPSPDQAHPDGPPGGRD